MLHSEQKWVHFCSEWSIVGYGTGAFWDLWNWSIQNGRHFVDYISKKKILITNIVYHLRLSVKKWLDIEYAHLCRWKSQHPSGFKKQTIYIWFHLTLGIVIEIGRTRTPKPFTVLICAYWFVMLYFVIKFCICHILYLNIILCVIVYIIMTSSNRNFFCVTGPLCGEFVGHRWIPLTKASDAELWCFLWSAPQETIEQTIETLVIWDAIVLILTSL